MKLYRFMSYEELTKYIDGERVEPIHAWWQSPRRTGGKTNQFVAFLGEYEFRWAMRPSKASSCESGFGRSLLGIVSGDVLASFSTTKAFTRKAGFRKVIASYYCGELYEYHADFYDNESLKLDWYVDADCMNDYPVDMAKCRRKDRRRRDAIKQKRARMK